MNNQRPVQSKAKNLKKTKPKAKTDSRRAFTPRTRNSRDSNLKKLQQKILKKKPTIKEIVREPTSGGIVFRPGETAKQTAIREIGEEAGLNHIQVLSWLGKIHFKYRRIDKLVLMTTQIYLVRSLDTTERPTKEKWMNGIKWFSFQDAINVIEYEDIEKLMLIAKKRIRQGEY